MTWPSFIGCALIAYALPFSMIYFIILRRPQLMIIFLFGSVNFDRIFSKSRFDIILVVRKSNQYYTCRAFMYLVSALSSAALWFANKVCPSWWLNPHTLSLACLSSLSKNQIHSIPMALFPVPLLILATFVGHICAYAQDHVNCSIKTSCVRQTRYPTSGCHPSNWISRIYTS